MSGEVIGVVDGKTLRIASQTGEIKVELQFREVPDRGQEMHETVKNHLRGLTKGKIVAYRPSRIGRDRTVGRVMLNNVDLSLQLIRDGAAWHVFSKSEGQDSSEYALYESTQAIARTEKIGIWSIPGMKTAWEVRAEQNEAAGRAQEARYPRASARSRPKPGVWGDTNPSIGDVGALMNGYNASTRTGYIGTSLLDVIEIDAASGIRMLVDLTYHYKQADAGRKGVYVLTIVSYSATEHFLKNNNLYGSVRSSPSERPSTHHRGLA
jgi:endonuclease YncB( thermonuclease family)